MNFKIALMVKHCPKFEEKMPKNNDPGLYRADVIVYYGYWGQHSYIAKSVTVKGFKNAYLKARWMALVHDFMRPAFLFNIGISYGIKALNVVPDDVQ